MIKEKHMSAGRGFRHGRAALCMVVGVSAVCRVAQAQTFVADKDDAKRNSDGALDLAGMSGIVELDPVARGIDTDKDNIFHFTSVTIPSGVRLKLTARKINGPVYWLVTGPVKIEGILDLSGETGHVYTKTAGDRKPAVPGPGGHPGGIGGIADSETVARLAAQPGGGPGGGAAGVWGDWRGISGTYSGNKFAVPLVGGPGGGGGLNTGDFFGAGGGAGGGAILIASSTSISVTGEITAWGGYGGREPNGNCNGVAGGAGSGGSIRLVAPTLSGGGTVEAGAGWSCRQSHATTAKGSVRLEAFNHSWTYLMRPQYTNYTTGSPVSSYVPTTAPPAIWVASIDGKTLSPNPTGSFDVPDLGANPQFSSTIPVKVVIKATNVPLKTTTKVSLYLVSLEEADMSIHDTSTLVMPPLTGTFGESTLTVDVRFPPGYSRGYARVKW